MLIQDLVVGAGYSYSRIAHHINVSPSTIQKLATNHDRKPRHIVFHRLLVLYYKVFHGPCRSPQAEAFITAVRDQLMHSARDEYKGRRRVNQACFRKDGGCIPTKTVSRL